MEAGAASCLQLQWGVCVSGRGAAVLAAGHEPLVCVQEVRLYTAYCLCQVLRIHAPETPYTDDQLKVGGAGVLA